MLVLKTVRDAEALNSCVKTIPKLWTLKIFYIMSRWLHYGKLSFKLLDMLTNKRYYIIRCKSKNSFTLVIVVLTSWNSMNVRQTKYLICTSYFWVCNILELWILILMINIVGQIWRNVFLSFLNNNINFIFINSGCFS